ncbi:MAG: topoisomerase DNA-binding C4 zinc finger domain-containing protein [Candidatus Tagabacteria bacterium]
MIEIYFDGACEPFNPGGTASYGWLIKKDGEILAQEGKIIGEGEGMTNNVGEYTGLIKALEALRGFDINNGKISIFGDSNLVCNMVAKKWGWNKKKTKWIPHEDAPHLKVLLEEVHNLIKDYDYEIKWIPEAQNNEADYLSRSVLLDAGLIKPDSKAEKCPMCNAKLLERKGPYNKFLGCSNYPKCKFTKNIVK